MSPTPIAELPPDVLEAVARWVHERYRKNQAGRKPADDPALGEWDALPEPLRRSNRAQARNMIAKLRMIGCTVHEPSGGAVEPISLSDDEIERMAVLEHRRWVADRLADDWTPGKRDVLERWTPDLVSWADLPEEEREWDREAVRAIPEALAAFGLEIRRTG